MSRESIAAISVVLLPLLLTALTALVAVAVRAINRYTKEGETISSEIASRYGN